MRNLETDLITILLALAVINIHEKESDARCDMTYCVGFKHDVGFCCDV